MRAADDDRAATVHVLQDAVARGLLTPDEGSDRMAAAFAAVHLRDLAPLTADLPAPPALAPAGAPGWQPLGLMAWEQLRTTVRGAPGRPAVWVALAAVLVLLLVALGLFFVEAAFDSGPGGLDPDWSHQRWDGPGPR
jgi:hypothetical protein